MISIHNLSKKYQNQTVVNDISLDIESGKLLGLIGHNGAGKSTLFKMILGLIKPNTGTIHFDNIHVNSKQFIEVKQSIGYLPENIIFYDNLTGLETLKFYAQLKNIPSSDCYRVLSLVDLEYAASKRVKEYSKGMKQRLGFAQALLGTPKFLFLDEPTNGLDPQGVKSFYDILFSLLDNGITIIITSHILAELQSKVSKLAIIQHGELKAMGSLDELRKRVSLPICFKLKIKQQNAHELKKHLLQIQGSYFEETNTDVIFVAPRLEKLQTLFIASQYANLIEDIEIIEPSLEDIFIDYIHN